MRASTSAIAAALLGVSSAQTVHTVIVSSPNGTVFAFSPNKVTAAIGDQVQFIYPGGNHSVAQSAFDWPCQPIQQWLPNVTGIFSGFEPVTPNSDTIPSYTVTVTDSEPVWLYCAQPPHCNFGMTMVINEDTAANATRSLDNYNAAAASAQIIIPTLITLGNASTAGLNNDTQGTVASAAANFNASSPISANGTFPSAANGTVPSAGTLTPPVSSPTTPPNMAAAISALSWTGLISVAASLALL